MGWAVLVRSADRLPLVLHVGARRNSCNESNLLMASQPQREADEQGHADKLPPVIAHTPIAVQNMSAPLARASSRRPPPKHDSHSHSLSGQ
jgi:hypothetical protein